MTRKDYESEDLTKSDTETLNDVINSVPSNMRNKAKQFMNKIMMHKDIIVLE